MQHHPQLHPHTERSTPQRKKVKDYQEQALKAAGYLHELLTDAVDYIPGQVKDVDGIWTMEATTNLGTKFSIGITFSKSELQLRANCASGIIQTEYAKIRYFLEDLECYLNAAHQW